MLWKSALRDSAPTHPATAPPPPRYEENVVDRFSRCDRFSDRKGDAILAPYVPTKAPMIHAIGNYLTRLT